MLPISSPLEKKNSFLCKQNILWKVSTIVKQLTIRSKHPQFQATPSNEDQLGKDNEIPMLHTNAAHVSEVSVK